MEVERAGYVTYAVTIRRNDKQDATETDYIPMLDHLIKSGVVIHELVYENDSGKTYAGMHVHGVLYIKKHFYRKRLMKDGFHIKMEEIYSWEGWQKYINKGYVKKIIMTEPGYTPTEEDLIDLSAYQQTVMDGAEDVLDDCCPQINIFKYIRDLKKK